MNWVVSITSSARSAESDASTCAFADSPRIATIATERETDDERARGGGRTTRVAHRVAAGDGAGDARGGADGCAEHPRQRPRERRQQHHDAEEEEDRAEPDRPQLRDGVVSRLRADDADDQDRHARTDQCRTEQRAPPEGVGPCFGQVADGGHRGDAGGPERRPQRRADGHEEAEREREPDGAREHDDLAARDAEPERVDQRHQQPRHEHADHEPGGGRGRAHDRGFEHDRGDDLLTRHAHRSQETELTRALRHQDGERVEDDEPADHEPERREPEQEAGEQIDELTDVLVVRARDEGGIGDLEVGTERRAERPAQRGGVDAGGAPHVDRVEEPGRGGDPLGGGEVERGERQRTGVGAVADGEEPDQLVRRARPGGEHVDLVAHVEAGGAGGVDVHRDLAGAGGRSAASPAVVDESQRARGPASDEGDTDGRAALVDRVAVAIEELRVSLYEAVGGRHAVGGAHCAEDRVRDPARVVVVGGGLAAHHDVDVGEGLREHPLERPVEGVGEHVRRGHEHDAEQHRSPRRREAEFAGQHAAQRDLQHGPLSRPRGPCRVARAPGDHLLPGRDANVLPTL